MAKFESQIFFQVSLFLRDQSIFRLGGKGPSILRGSHSFQEEQRGGSVVTNRISRGGGRYRKLTADRRGRVSEPYGRNQVNFTVTQTDP